MEVQVRRRVRPKGRLLDTVWDDMKGSVRPSYMVVYHHTSTLRTFGTKLKGKVLNGSQLYTLH